MEVKINETLIFLCGVKNLQEKCYYALLRKLSDLIYNCEVFLPLILLS